jgi:hypothetical protein
MMGVSLGGFDPPPLTLRLSVRSHYATMTRCDKCPASQREHKSVIDFTMSRLTILMTFLIINPINHLNDFYYHYSDKCPAVAQICHRLHYVPINHINNFFNY